MSLLHDMIENYIRKTHVPYDRNANKDYEQLRNQELSRVKNPPRGVEIEYLDRDEIKGERLYVPESKEKRAILYIHGGGFVGGFASTRRECTSYIAGKTGIPVYSINYPLSPESIFPEALDTCLRAYEYLSKSIGARNMIVMGESAGGNLVLTTMLKAKDLGMELPGCLIVMAPVTQLYQLTDSYRNNEPTDAIVDSTLLDECLDKYLGGNEELKTNPYVSPLLGDFKGFPRTQIVVSDSECLYDDSTLLFEKMKKDGVDVKIEIAHKKMHTFPVIIQLSEAKRYLKKEFEFIEESFKEK